MRLDQPLDAQTGYRPAFTEALGPRTKNDAREGFVIHVKGREAGTNAVRFRGDVSGTPPRFQAAAKQLLAETLDAAQRLVKASSVAMGLAGPEKDFFDGIMDGINKFGPPTLVHSPHMTNIHRESHPVA